MSKEQKDSRKIAIVIGTKAELIKCLPLMLELQKRREDYWFIHTGQHSLGKTCVDFGIKKPDLILSEEPTEGTKFWSKVNRISFLWFFHMIHKIRAQIRKINPKYIIYHGDTMSTAAASIASSKILNIEKKWNNVHLEAGLRSGSLFEPFPEEISRQISDSFSHLLLAVSDLSEENLKKDMKVWGEIRKVGNTVVDSSLITYDKSKKRMKKKTEEYVLINLHRHENLRSKKRMRKIVEILKGVGIKGVWPLHENTEYYLKRYGLMEDLRKLENLEITPLEDYFTFIFLLANCKYLITDGGSIQEESLVFKKPCVLLRKRTERQEGLLTGINFLTKLDVEEAKKIIKEIEDGKIKVKNFENPYGKRGLSKKILDGLK